MERLIKALKSTVTTYKDIPQPSELTHREARQVFWDAGDVEKLIDGLPFIVIRKDVESPVSSTDESSSSDPDLVCPRSCGKKPWKTPLFPRTGSGTLGAPLAIHPCK